MPTLETERLLLRELNPDVYEYLFTTCSDDEIAAFLNLKSADFWLYPETFPISVSTDSLGFRVLPAGMMPYFKNGFTCFWTPSQLYPGYVWVVTFTYYHKEVRLNTTINFEGLNRGQSVRCVKDY